MTLPKIDFPTYETELISNGKKIKFRPFLVKEQKLFLMAAESKEIKDILGVIKDVLGNCILTDINIDDLPMFDVIHLFLQLRARSVNEIINLKYICQNDVIDENNETKKCGNTVKMNLDILNIHPKKDPSHKKEIEITDTLGIVMGYPTLKSIESLDSNDINNLSLKFIIKCVHSIYDAENTYYAKDYTEQQLEEFLEQLDTKAIEKIHHFFETIPSYNESVHFHCKKCGYEEDIVIKELESFFV